MPTEIFTRNFFNSKLKSLDSFESGLLVFEEQQKKNTHAINEAITIIHSIKLGGLILNYKDIEALSNSIHLTLIAMRDGPLDVSPGSIDILHHSSTCLRNMMESKRDGVEYNAEEILSVKEQLQGLLAA